MPDPFGFGSATGKGPIHARANPGPGRDLHPANPGPERVGWAWIGPLSNPGPANPGGPLGMGPSGAVLGPALHELTLIPTLSAAGSRHSNLADYPALPQTQTVLPLARS